MTRPACRRAGASLLALLSLAACAGADHGLTAMPPAAPSRQTDAGFLARASQSGLAVVAAARLAQTHATRADIRDFAAEIVSDHGKVNDALASLARQKELSPPTAPAEADEQILHGLQVLRGTSFDRQFLDWQVAALQRAVALYRQEAQQGSDPDVTFFAAHVLPELQQHLSEAQNLGGRVATGEEG